MALGKEEELLLSELFKGTIQKYLEQGRFLEKPTQVPSGLLQKKGIFTTIKKIEKASGKLRTLCCVGYLFPVSDLVESLLTLATNCAIRIRSIEKIGFEDFKNLILEISIIDPPELLEGKPLEYAKKIDVEHDGIMVRDGPRVSVIIPSELSESKPTAEEYIGECCAKVGLTADAWIVGKVKVYRFRAYILRVV
jgi:uncharacterized protein (TIGR00296 family)